MHKEKFSTRLKATSVAEAPITALQRMQLQRQASTLTAAEKREREISESSGSHVSALLFRLRVSTTPSSCMA